MSIPTSVSSWESLGFFSSPIEGREKEGEAKCSDLEWGQSFSSRYACLRQSGPQPRRVWCLLQAGAEKPMSDHPGEGCALGEPFHILPRGLDSTTEPPMPHLPRGLNSSCPIELVSCWTLISLQPESIWTSIHQSTITLRNDLET